MNFRNPLKINLDPLQTMVAYLALGILFSQVSLFAFLRSNFPRGALYMGVGVVVVFLALDKARQAWAAITSSSTRETDSK